MINIIEIKARSTQHTTIREILKTNQAKYQGTDHQIDTYFNTTQGRLKLREGKIESNLIQYHRENKEGPKHSTVSLYKSTPNSSLKQTLSNALGVLTVVDKSREIYFIDNVKFHIDIVKDLGTFIEIEAIDEEGLRDNATLLKQCEQYMELFAIAESDLVKVSYSDLLLAKG